jgi:hypothetical protein
MAPAVEPSDAATLPYATVPDGSAFPQPVYTELSGDPPSDNTTRKETHTMPEELTIGSWVSTTAGCPVRYLVGEDHNYATLILGSTNREFEIALDTATLAEVVRLGAQTLQNLAGASEADRDRDTASLPDSPTNDAEPVR